MDNPNSNPIPNPNQGDVSASGEETEAYKLAQMVNQFAATFHELCRERHEHGQSEYGELTFLGNDVTRMLIEELADTVNYCTMQAVKLMMLESRFEAEVLPRLEEGKLATSELGFQAFKGTKDVGWNKS